MKVVYLASHPIQYHAPLFRALAARCEFEAWFAHRPTAAEQAAAGYGVAFDWDVDLLSGYRNRFLENVARHPTVLRPLGTDTPEVAAWLAESRPDVLIVGGWMLRSYWQAFRAAERIGVPAWIRTDSRWPPGGSRLKALAKRALYRIALRRPRGFLAAGRGSADYLTSLGVPADRIVEVPHVVDVERFETRRVDPAQTRAALGIADGPVVGFVGRLIAGKRVADLLFAAARLEPRCRVLIVGDGEERERLRALARDQGVFCVMAGFRNQEELPALYQIMDVLALPSSHDTWGLVVNEALAAGCSVVISDEAGAADALGRYSPAVLTYRTGNVEALAGQLGLALRGRGDAEVEAQRERAVALLHPARVADQILAALASGQRQAP